jgi:protein O-GlcNAc transferase
VTENLEDYETLALALARDPARLHAVKEKLARNLSTTPLFDAGRFRQAIEDAYLRMSVR